MSRLFLARHGETDWNARGKLQGHTDIPLNDSGRAQARALAARLEQQQISSVTTSDLIRAGETGAIVARELGVASVHTDHELRERRFGVFEGLTREECASRYPEAWRAWVEQTAPPEGAEPRELAIPRLTRALTRALDRAAGAPSLVVSHGGVMRLWLIETTGAPVPLIGNAAVYVVERVDGTFHVTLWGA